ncbi:hypothetical protein CROQUDRAFT_659221 [Cronartium quercuum f. sp. fusiforme G11]|uniref:Peroxin-3 n=1 Tax=Cronartium quercuum f. sp. fusiforme G11 TaxID=708437 RepID=A0A9P6TBV8_9BASI|nr:hypothetical protein CROQUDRAFT_659221 [Cronartium quercuum f. sp. fusiforme G11]
MIGLLTRFLERRRRPLTVLVTTIGGGYILLSYIKNKLDEIQDAFARNRHTTENLTRRFHQNQDDCLFTVTALVPTIGNQILEFQNVERLAELLTQTKTPRLVDSTEAIDAPTLSLPTQDTSSSPTIDHGKATDPKPENVTSLPEQSSSVDKSEPQQAISGSSTSPLVPSKLPLNGATQPNTSPPANESTVDIPFRPDGTALRKRSEIWKEVMVLSFTRLFTCIYAIALLTMQTHIQLGLLGRDAYLTSVIGADELDSHAQGSDGLYAVPKDRLVDTSTEQRYLTFSWWYLHHGWRLLSNRIRATVEEVLSSKSLKDDINLSDLEQIFSNIRHKVEEREDGEAFSFSAILLPSTTLDELDTLRSGGMAPIDCVVDSRLRGLLNETQDFIDCDDFHTVLRKGVEHVTAKCLENVGRRSSLEEFVQPKAQLPSQDPSQLLIHPRFLELANEEPPPKTARFVAILPFITRESHYVLNSLPNEYTEVFSATTELKEFSSVIYTSFDV